MNAETVDHSNLKNVMFDIVTQYCVDHDIKENDSPPQIWNDIIDEIHETLIKLNKAILRDIPSVNNEYNMEKVYHVYNCYKRLCNSHCQVVNLKGFIDLTGIDKQTIYNWAGKSSHAGVDFHQKIMSDNAQSLEAMLHDKRINPMKVLPSLNRHHGWAQPGVTREVARPRELRVEDLPKLALYSSIESDVD